MHHTLGDRPIEHGMHLCVQDLSAIRGIKLFCGARPVIGVHDRCMCVCGRLRFWNSTVYTKPVTRPRMWRFVTSVSSSSSISLKTRLVRSGLQAQHIILRARTLSWQQNLKDMTASIAGSFQERAVSAMAASTTTQGLAVSRYMVDIKGHVPMCLSPSLVFCILTAKKLPVDLWPGWGGGESDEERRLALGPANGHGILEQLLHAFRPSRKTGCQDNLCCHAICSVTCTEGILPGNTCGVSLQHLKCTADRTMHGNCDLT